MTGEADAIIAKALVGQGSPEHCAEQALKRYKEARLLWRGNQQFIPRLLEHMAVAHALLGDDWEAKVLRGEAAEIRLRRPSRLAGHAVQIQDDLTYVQSLPTV